MNNFDVARKAKKSMSEIKPIYSFSEQPQQQKQNGLGIAIGLVICALCFLAFPKFVEMLPWLAWTFDGIGFVVLLIGILGTCSILFETK